MKKMLVMAAFAAMTLWAEADVALNCTTDRKPVDYKSGDTATFSITALDGGEPIAAEITWTLDADKGTAETAKGKGMTAPGKPVQVPVKLNAPGFVRLTVNTKGSNGKDVRFIAGACADMNKLTPPEEPADFDEFWNGIKKTVASADLSKAQLEPAAKEFADKRPNYDMFMLRIPYEEGKPAATAWVFIPKNAENKSSALSFFYNGYGWSGQTPGGAWGDRIITVQVNAHGFELARDKEYYDDFKAKVEKDGKYGFSAEQNSDPKTTYFHDMIVRDLIVIRWAKSLPQWNGRDLTVSGGSQGGFQCILMAALDKDVTLCKPNAPWLCDFSGNKTAGRMKGWRPECTAALMYFDPVIHAKRIKCKTDVERAGLGDYTCPPSGITLFYNNLSCPKRIKYVQGSEHHHWGAVPKYWDVEVIESGFSQK